MVCRRWVVFTSFRQFVWKNGPKYWFSEIRYQFFSALVISSLWEPHFEFCDDISLADVIDFGKISTKSGHKMQKNQIFQNPLCNFVDISSMLLQNPKWGSQRVWVLKKIDNGRNFESHFGNFPILNVEKAQKRPNFGASYLHNRLKLRGKWAHFENKITRATTYVQTKKKGSFCTPGSIFRSREWFGVKIFPF